MSSTETLNNLFKEEKIHVERSDFLLEKPCAMSEKFSFSKVRGMLLGLCIGDSLGNTSESMGPGRRHKAHGEIRDYLPNRHLRGKAAGLPSDDTQLAFWTLEQLIEDKELNPENLADKFSSGLIFGVGGNVKNFLGNYKSGMSWDQAGPRSAGNGALMRIAPVVVPHILGPSEELWADAAIAGMVTHNDRASISACVAFVNILWNLLNSSAAPEPNWWKEIYFGVASGLEGNSLLTPRGGDFTDYHGSLSNFIQEKLTWALDNDLSVREACDSWYSGAYLMETVPSVLYILMRHADDPEEAIVRAVNDTKDNDTVAAIVGAAVGALHGEEALPRRWVDKLLGRTRENDDGRVFELINQAEEQFWTPGEKDDR
jgi:ADP-ribosyl-[dinitrogen reductase] hydrolase